MPASNLPPGCTDRDIERAQGTDYPSECFDAHQGFHIVCVECGEAFTKAYDAHGHADRRPDHDDVLFFISDTICIPCNAWIRPDPQTHYDEEHRYEGPDPDEARDRKEDR